MPVQVGIRPSRVALSHTGDRLTVTYDVVVYSEEAGEIRLATDQEAPLRADPGLRAEFTRFLKTLGDHMEAAMGLKAALDHAADGGATKAPIDDDEEL